MMASIFGLLPPTEDEKDKGRRGKKNKPEIQSNVVGAVMESFIEGARSIREKPTGGAPLRRPLYRWGNICEHISAGIFPRNIKC